MMIKRFFVLFFAGAFIFLLLMLIRIGLSYSDAKEHIINESRHMIQTHKERFDLTVQHVKDEVLFLSKEKYARAIFDSKNTDGLSSQFLNYITNEKIYDQIRFLDISGKEIVRVNYNNGNPQIVSKDKLQNKAGRDYFHDLVSLEKDEFYISKLDLNIENGEIELPIKPTIRFATSVFDANNKKIGYIIVNYLADNFLNELKKQNPAFEEKTLFLNKDGNYIIGLKNDNEWEFVFKKESASSFASDFPISWSEIKESVSGHIENDEGVIEYLNICSDSNDCNSDLKLVVYLSQSKIYKLLIKFFIHAVPFYFIFLIFFGVVLVLFLKNSAKKENAEMALKKMNETLQEEIDRKIKKYQEQESLLIQQSKLAAMGEMIQNIAHQWRQPLNTLGLQAQDILEAYNYKELTKEYLENQVNSMMNTIYHMSKTIDNFKNFFRADKEKQEFLVTNTLKECLDIFDASLRHNNIEIEINEKFNPKINGYKNEYAQAVLNILANAKDALEKNNNKNKTITITIDKTPEGSSILSIEDNGGGIGEEYKDKVFEPYFTTKYKSNGTGIGLYMSKVIIEKHMHGSLEFTNINDGVRFDIVV